MEVPSVQSATVLVAQSEDYTTAPQHLHVAIERNFLGFASKSGLASPGLLIIRALSLKRNPMEARRHCKTIFKGIKLTNLLLCDIFSCFCKPLKVCCASILILTVMNTNQTGNCCFRSVRSQMTGFLNAGRFDVEREFFISRGSLVGLCDSSLHQTIKITVRIRRKSTLFERLLPSRHQSNAIL